MSPRTELIQQGVSSSDHTATLSEERTHTSQQSSESHVTFMNASSAWPLHRGQTSSDE